MPFDKQQFFENIIAGLVADGTLRTYDSLYGTPHPEWDESDKKDRTVGGAINKSLPGTVSHIGDEPYNGLTSERLRFTPFNHDGYQWKHKPVQRDMALKFTSVSRAINAYMPHEAFAAYLQDFAAHLDDPQHQASLKNTMKAIKRQCRLAPVFVNEEPDGVLRSHRFNAMIEAGDGNQLRNRAHYSLVKEHFARYPELTTALSIYHAAHAAYLMDLYAALEKTCNISEEERDNALHVIESTSFHQFEDFLIFQTLLPLAIHAYDHADSLAAVYQHPSLPGAKVDAASVLSQGCTHVGVDHERMRMAITTAWNILFDKNLLMRHFRDDGSSAKPDEVPYAKMVCPAHGHLKASMKAGLVESLYAGIVAQPNTHSVTRLIASARETGENLKYK